MPSSLATGVKKVVSTAQALPKGTIQTTAEPVELEMRASFSSGTPYFLKKGLPARTVTAMEQVPSTKSSRPNTKEMSCAPTGDLTSLRSLEEDGVVVRTVYPEVPPRVEYSLSKLGESMRPILDALETFGLNYQSLAGAGE